MKVKRMSSRNGFVSVLEKGSRKVFFSIFPPFPLFVGGAPWLDPDLHVAGGGLVSRILQHHGDAKVSHEERAPAVQHEVARLYVPRHNLGLVQRSDSRKKFLSCALKGGGGVCGK